MAMQLRDYTCRACGKVAHSADKAGRLLIPGNCPYCGIENPYSIIPLWRIALVGVLLVVGLLAISMPR